MGAIAVKPQETSHEAQTVFFFVRDALVHTVFGWFEAVQDVDMFFPEYP